MRPRARVIASGVEQDDFPSGLGDGPARARLLVAVRSGAGGESERLWRWRLEAVSENGRALVSSAEVVG
ncbi:MAG: hypothetical protein H5T80_06105 [Dietzia sp.]|nr:hypothetical protein [Dietzia sp.]